MPRIAIRVGAALATTTLIAVAATNLAYADDSAPTPQAVFAHAEFLANTPAPPTGAGAVCVIDTGVSPLPDLDSQVIERIAVDGGSPDDIDHIPGDPTSGHGTFVAATIASRRDGIGSVGIWPAARIVSVRVVQRPSADAMLADYRNAIFSCMRVPEVRVITISLSTPTTTDNDLARLNDRVTEARQLGINVVASAGNNGAADGVNFPARAPSVLAVGAADPAGLFCAGSNHGVGLDTSALGCGVPVTTFTGRAQSLNGTSFSTPIVSGVLDALRSYRPDLTVNTAEQLILASSRKSPAGPIVDATSLFEMAGLRHLVTEQGPGTTSSEPAPSTSVADQPNGPTPTSQPHRRLTRRQHRPATPRLKRGSYLRKRLRLHTTNPPHEGLMIFRIGHRHYETNSGHITIPLRRWQAITVRAVNKCGTQSAPLHIPKRRVVRARR